MGIAVFAGMINAAFGIFLAPVFPVLRRSLAATGHRRTRRSCRSSCHCRSGQVSLTTTDERTLNEKT
jgi:hypothetical protein